MEDLIKQFKKMANDLSRLQNQTIFNYSMYNLRMIKKQTENLFSWEETKSVKPGECKYQAIFKDSIDGIKYKVTIEPVNG